MKVGIVTMFYNSSNYGGILQAYALTKAINKYGMEAEQINYNHFTAFSVKRRMKMKMIKYVSLIKNPKHFKLFLKILKRSKIIADASAGFIPHSRKIYTEKNLYHCVPNYLAFITGSDQVWYGEWPAYFLTFVPSGMKKIAYAASTGKSQLSELDIKKIKNSTSDFTAISVREADTKKTLINYILDKNIELVLDPTLILEKDDWETIASPRKIGNEYLFCYFLGRDERIRKLAKEYANKHKLKIVTIPHMQGKIEKNDLGFGDLQLFDTTPQEFLSLIKYANIVFTDSFHASVFSQIFQTQYITFERSEHKEMNNRMITLTEMFHTTHRFISKDTAFNLNYIENIEKVDYSIISNEYEDLKKKSLDFLINSLQ